MTHSSVVIVEDDVLIGTAFTNILRKTGYMTQQAYFGHEALEFAHQTSPDLFIMDIRLPDGDGIDTASRILSEHDVPIVFVTAHWDESTFTRALEISHYGYLIKPVTEQQLLVTVKMALQQHSLRKRFEEERNRLESQLHQSQKLESLGIMAGGIAHDFNNILNTISLSGEVGILALNARDYDEVRKRLLNMKTSVSRATHLTSQLLTFSRGGLPVKKNLPIKAMLTRAIELSIGSSITTQIEVDYAPDLPNAMVDEGQIVHVFTNLLLNADQAMPQGGTIRIRVGHRIVEKSSVPGVLTPGAYLRISLSDEGTGIPPEQLSHLFDPFYTSRQKGSSLGLAIVHSIVSKHGGSIDLESTVGQGTTFTLYLPAASAASVDKAPSPRTLVVEKLGRILIMDDEKLIRSAFSKLLRIKGYEVDTVAEGREALALYKEVARGQNPYVLVILDLTIPGGMDGVETLKHLKKINPEIKALVVSGYSDDAVLQSPQTFGFRAGMQKPLDIEELLKTIQSIL